MKAMSKMRQNKVAIIGAGNVGGMTAQRLMEKEVAELVLIDIVPGLAEGKVLDMIEATPIDRQDVQIVGTTDYTQTEGADVVIITSGVARKPGMNREDLLRVNTNIVKTVTQAVAEVAPGAILIVVSNPLDAMTYVAYKTSLFSSERVMGMAGVLDSSRFCAFIAMELGVSVRSVQTFVLGSHGDLMVPLPRLTTVGGVPVTELLSKARLDRLIKRTRDGGAEIVALLKTGSAYFAPSAAIVEMVESILHNRKKVLPCTAFCKGEYALDNLFMGVPVKLGKGGVEEIIELRLTVEEAAALKQSEAAIRNLCAEVDRMLSL